MGYNGYKMQIEKKGMVKVRAVIITAKEKEGVAVDEVAMAVTEAVAVMAIRHRKEK
jgi:hypothetical protein